MEEQKEGEDQVTDRESHEIRKRRKQEQWVGMLAVRKDKILVNLEENPNYVFRKTPEGTHKHVFNDRDLISSLPNKPVNYWIKVGNKCVEDQLLANIRGRIVELVPKTVGGSQAFFNRASEQPLKLTQTWLQRTRHSLQSRA